MSAIIFDQLRVSDDGNRLFIDLHVSLADYYDSTHLHALLKSLTITTAENVPDSASFPDIDKYIYKRIYPVAVNPSQNTYSGKTEDHLILDIGDLSLLGPIDGRHPSISGEYANTWLSGNFSGPLLFVFAEVRFTGTINGCTPCGVDETVTLAVTFDTNLLYQRVMDYTKQFGDECTVPTGFTDYILLWNAFKASVETEHYVPAIKYYNMLFGISHESPTRDGSHSPFGGVGTTSKIFKPCNCNG